MTTIELIDRECDLAPEVQASHRSLSPLDWEFRRHALANPEYLLRSTFAGLEVPADFEPYPFQSWPAFVTRGFAAEAFGVAAEIVRLIKGIPRWLYGNDPVKLSQAYGTTYPPMLLELLLAEPNGIAPGLARGDFIFDQDGMKCLEVNLSGSVGGWEVAILAAQYLEVPAIARFLAERGVTVRHVDPLPALLTHVVEEAQRHVRDLGEEVNVAFVADASWPLPETPYVRDFLAAAYGPLLAREGLRGRAITGSVDRLEARGGVVTYQGMRVHAVIETNLARSRPEVYRGFKAGRVALFNGPLELLLTNKRNLALLSEAAERGLLSPADGELVRRHVPWTRELRREETTYEGQPVELEAFCLDQRGRLVLKPVMGRGGRGVTVGDAVGAQEWRAQITVALDQGGHLVQERVRSRRFLYQYGEQGAATHEMVWGPFCFGPHYGGQILRLQPDSVGGPVNVARHATGCCLFEVVEAPPG